MFRVWLVVFVALAHIAVLLGMRLALSGEGAQTAAHSVFSMINLEAISEREAAPAPEQKRAVETRRQESEALAAENFVEKEPEAELTEGVGVAAPDSERAEIEGRLEKSIAEKQAYVQKNYLYIQRRIQNALLYPSEALRTAVGGEAEVDFIICIDGSIRALTVRRSSGSSLLDAAALEAVRRAAPFRPPKAELRIVIPVRFSLR